MRIARTAVDGLLYSFDRPFDYELPEALHGLQPGCRVRVGFGKAKKDRLAMVLAVFDGEPDKPLKPVLSAVDPEPLLTPELLDLAQWIAERRFCCLYEAVRLMLPTGLDYRERLRYIAAPNLDQNSFDELSWSVLSYTAKTPRTAAAIRRETGADEELIQSLAAAETLTTLSDTVRRVGDRTVRMLEPARDTEVPAKLPAKQKLVLDYLAQHGRTAAKQICYDTGVSTAVLDGLLKKKLALCSEELSYRGACEASEPIDPDSFVLTPGQQAAYEQLAGYTGAALLYGVTGSGKTLVLLKLVQKTLAQGRTAILMVPEILLTPQFTRLFTGCFGDRVAVIHSGLSDGVRADEFRRIREGKADLVIGTRSAIFAPLTDIGLISMDEEQEAAYKSESSPRYDAAEAAVFRAAKNGALFLKMSATPSIRTRCAADRSRARLVTLPGRYGQSGLPEVEVVDMRTELPVEPGGVLGPTLTARLEANTREGFQSVLLLNRRGHDTIVLCYDCGEVLKCPHCSVALNYHSANHRYLCHWCGYGTPEAVCPKCGSTRMRFLGGGTQKVEEELHTLLPSARVLRMDTDTAFTRESHEKLFHDFAGGEYDILLGTQMVAKGLDFERVTLAGVLGAEQGLYSEDYLGPERTFALLTQVVGRCGRGRYPGRAVIQTYLPEHRILEYAKNQDYEGFYADELKLRRQLLYPPFCDTCLFGISGPDPAKTATAAAELLNSLRAAFAGGQLPVRAYGPAPAQTFRVSDRYRYRITLKCRSDRAFRAAVADILKTFANAHRTDGITVFADCNPAQMY